MDFSAGFLLLLLGGPDPASPRHALGCPAGVQGRAFPALCRVTATRVSKQTMQEKHCPPHNTAPNTGHFDTTCLHFPDCRDIMPMPRHRSRFRTQLDANTNWLLSLNESRNVPQPHFFQQNCMCNCTYPLLSHPVLGPILSVGNWYGSSVSYRHRGARGRLCQPPRGTFNECSYGYCYEGLPLRAWVAAVQSSTHLWS